MQEQLARDIRIAQVNRDVLLLAKVVGDPEIERHLQAAGEALLSLREHLTTNQNACLRLSADLAARLDKRAWPGAFELACLLREEQAAGSRRRRIRADLEQVADLLEGSIDMGFGGVLDLQTGAVWPEAVLDDWALEEPRPDPDDDPERYLSLPREGSRDAWNDMRDFATGIADEGARGQMLHALDGKGAFGRSNAPSTGTPTCGPPGTATPPRPDAVAPEPGSPTPATTPSHPSGSPLVRTTRPHPPSGEERLPSVSRSSLDPSMWRRSVGCGGPGE